MSIQDLRESKIARAADEQSRRKLAQHRGVIRGGHQRALEVGALEIGIFQHRFHWKERCSTGEDVIATDLSIERRQDLIELSLRRSLGRGLPAVVERESTLLAEGLLYGGAAGGELGQNRLANAQGRTRRRRRC